MCALCASYGKLRILGSVSALMFGVSPIPLGSKIECNCFAMLDIPMSGTSPLNDSSVSTLSCCFWLFFLFDYLCVCVCSRCELSKSAVDAPCRLLLIRCSPFLIIHDGPHGSASSRFLSKLRVQASRYRPLSHHVNTRQCSHVSCIEGNRRFSDRSYYGSHGQVSGLRANSSFEHERCSQCFCCQP